MRKLHPISFDKAEDLALKLGNQSIRSIMTAYNQAVKEMNVQIDEENAIRQATGGRGTTIYLMVFLGVVVGFWIGFLITKI